MVLLQHVHLVQLVQLHCLVHFVVLDETEVRAREDQGVLATTSIDAIVAPARSATILCTNLSALDRSFRLYKPKESQELVRGVEEML